MEPTGSTAFTVVAVELSYMKYVISGAALLNLLNQGWNPPTVISVEQPYMNYLEKNVNSLLHIATSICNFDVHCLVYNAYDWLICVRKPYLS
jgi:hypothetical protein